MARVQLQRVLSATLHFVVIQKQSQTAPPRTGGPSVAFYRIRLVSSRSSFSSSTLRHPPPTRRSLSAFETSQFPLLLTRRDVLLMKMKGLLIFSLPAGVGAGSCPPSFFLSIVDLFLPALLLPFSPTFSPPGWRTPIQPAFSILLSLSLSLCSSSLPPLLAAVILLSVYQIGLPRECDNELCTKLIQTDIMHASVIRSQNLRKKKKSERRHSDKTKV